MKTLLRNSSLLLASSLALNLSAFGASAPEPGPGTELKDRSAKAASDAKPAEEKKEEENRPQTFRDAHLFASFQRRDLNEKINGFETKTRAESVVPLVAADVLFWRGYARTDKAWAYGASASLGYMLKSSGISFRPTWRASLQLQRKNQFSIAQGGAVISPALFVSTESFSQAGANSSIPTPGSVDVKFVSRNTTAVYAGLAAPVDFSLFKAPALFKPWVAHSVFGTTSLSGSSASIAVQGWDFGANLAAEMATKYLFGLNASYTTLSKSDDKLTQLTFGASLGLKL